ncbi:hypothetical protein ABTD22_20890, partial [Acinetobacter baumannii]
AAAIDFRDHGRVIGQPGEGRLPQARLASFEGVVPQAVNWRVLGACPEEAALYADKEEAVA